MLVVLPSFGAARDAVLSATVACLSRDVDLELMTPLAGDPDFVKEMQRLGVRVSPMPTIRLGASEAWLDALLGKALKQFGLLRLAALGSDTVRIEQKALQLRRPVWYAGKRALWRVAGGVRSTDRLRTLRARLGAVTSPVSMDGDAVVFYDLFNPALEAAVRMRPGAEHPAPARIGVVQSWDNLTSKGTLPTKFDRLFVWNDEMCLEALQFYEWLSPNAVEATGGLMFDVVKKVNAARSTLHEVLGVDPQKRTVTFLLGYPDNFPSALDQVQLLATAAKDGRLGDGVQLIVRTQPGPRSAPLSEALRHMQDVVTVDDPASREGGGLTWTDYRREVEWYTTLLSASDVVVNFPSTTTIDAARLDVPSVTIAFDGPVPKPYHESLRRTLDRNHYRWVSSRAGNRIAMTEAELLLHVRSYLDDPSRDALGRSAVAALGGALDNSAGVRVAESILGLLSQRSSGSSDDA